MKNNFIITLIFTTLISSGVCRAQKDTSSYQRKMQVTLIYPVGSNGVDATKYTNNFSVNVFAGISNGVKGFEMGSIANHSNGNIDGFQIAGISNSSLGYLSGVQLSGVSNYNKGFAKAVQAAGISNINLNDFSGLQVSGISNIADGRFRGAQFGGISNLITGNFNGLQAAGIVNVIVGTAEGAQFGGIVNLSVGQVRGGQAAGILNIAVYNVKGIQAGGIGNFANGHVRGTQLSGIVNIATDSIRGTQLGLINYTDKLKGLQIGLINVSGSVEKGVPIGLLSIVRNGYHKAEVEANETFYANVSVKTGVSRFYNIYTAAYTRRNGVNMWAVGLGVGTMMPLSKTIDMNIDLITKQVNEDEWWTEEMNLINTLKLNASCRISEGLEIFGGPSFNVSVSQLEDSEGNVIGDSFVPYSFFNKTYKNETNVKMYVGFDVGLRF